MSNLAPVRNCPKGERKAKLDYIRSIRHFLTNFRKISLFWYPTIWTESLKLKNKKMHRPNSFKGGSELAF